MIAEEMIADEMIANGASPLLRQQTPMQSGDCNVIKENISGLDMITSNYLSVSEDIDIIEHECLDTLDCIKCYRPLSPTYIHILDDIFLVHDEA